MANRSNAKMLRPLVQRATLEWDGTPSSMSLAKKCVLRTKKLLFTTLTSAMEALMTSSFSHSSGIKHCMPCSLLRVLATNWS